jgi:hypothetical protein
MDITGGLSWRAFEEPLFCCIAGCCVISGTHCKVWDYLWERETSTGIVVRCEFCIVLGDSAKHYGLGGRYVWMGHVMEQ